MRDLRIEPSGATVLARCALVHLSDFAASGVVSALFPPAHADRPGIDAADGFLEMRRSQVQGRGGQVGQSPQPGVAGLGLRGARALVVLVPR
jgi:hypothetical protein